MYTFVGIEVTSNISEKIVSSNMIRHAGYRFLDDTLFFEIFKVISISNERVHCVPHEKLIVILLNNLMIKKDHLPKIESNKALIRNLMNLEYFKEIFFFQVIDHFVKKLQRPDQ